MKKIVGVSFLSFWICVCSLAQTQIYVSPRGNDKAEGTLKKPLRTIQAAVDKASQKKDADVENLTNMLYKKTRLEDTFGWIGRWK